MFDVVLFEPEIPPNTGNIIRLCAATGCRLHLIEPLGFDISAKSLRRAGLDYHEFVEIRTHKNWTQCSIALDELQIPAARRFALSTKAQQSVQTVSFMPGDAFLFGPETRGLPQEILASFGAAQCIRLPMLPERRSLNLANAVSVLVYEAWRQIDYQGQG